MHKAFLTEMKTRLEQEAQALTERLRKFTSRDAHGHDPFAARFPQYGSKEDENAAEVATFQDSLGLERDLEVSLQEVLAALKKIDAGTYGRCANCGELIEERRLKAFPAAARCVRCKTSG